MSKTEVLTARIVGEDDLSRPLKKASDSLNKFQDSVNQSTRSFRMMRGGAAQLGMQVQDVAVQLQGGTAAMTVFAQQGSQIASLFGTKRDNRRVSRGRRCAQHCVNSQTSQFRLFYGKAPKEDGRLVQSYED